MYKPNKRMSNYMRQKLTEMQGETDLSAVTVGKFNAPLSKMDRHSSRNQQGQSWTQHHHLSTEYNGHSQTTSSNNGQNTFFSSSPRTFTMVDHVLGHKTHHSELKRREIIQCLLLDHKGIKQEIKKKKKTRKSQNTWRWNNTLRNTIWVKE